MKRFAVNFVITALLATVALPSFAQDDKKEEKEKEVKEKKKNVEQIVITRNSDAKEKTVIEINGDKITVNGKPIEDLKDGDVKVHRNKYKTLEGLNAYSFPRSGVGQGFTWNGDHDNNFGLFSDVDQNRAMLGVVTEEVEGGVKVTELTEESAAKKAGIKEGDIITKINETKIEEPDQLSQVVRKHKPGDKVTVTLLRDKKEQKISAELGKWKGVSAFGYGPGQNFKMDMPDYKDLIAPRIQGTPYFNRSGGQPKLGLSVQDTDDGKGVKVIEVDEESNAAKAGLKENDILTHFNDKEVNSADEVAKLVRENKDKPTINLKVKRDGKTQNIEVKMPRKLKTADI